MAKNIQVNLAFTADTKAAKAALKDLQSELNTLLVNAPTQEFGLTDDVSHAVAECAKLKVALQSATDETGKLNLDSFKKELNAANLDADKVAQSFMQLGADGYEAFYKISRAIANAEMPLKRVNTLVQKFAQTLTNTIRWQISSTALNALTGAVSSAYYYAQDLNKSLNDIRIVSGQSAEDMKEFAKYANESAKALSTNTTAYADAALIFYQAGFSEEEVKKRTDAVIKMSNVTGESVSDVSSYMMAIWNNFDDGSQSLEYYADVLTRLGADTAASTEELAEGLEKFASIGETVGLSYEYATASLATVIDKTRQSADVVGTAFKTIFARIQDLELGDTLDDGTTLGSYSQALEKIGIDIKDASGEVKDMNDILDEMGEKWQTLDRATKVATAEAVAGVRQYTQLISLMDNWDTQQSLAASALGSEGSLQEQADIYEESWEAARKRVAAAAQEIYSQLVNDDFFISLNDALAGTLGVISNLIDSFGGLSGAVTTLGAVFLKVFSSNLSSGIDNYINNLKLSSERGRKAIIEEKQKWSNKLIEMSESYATGVPGASAAADVYRTIGEFQNQYIEKTVNLQAANREISQEQQKQVATLMDLLQAQGQRVINDRKQVDILEEQTAELKKQAVDTIAGTSGNRSSKKTIQQDINEYTKYYKTIGMINYAYKAFNLERGKDADTKGLKKWLDSLNDIDSEILTTTISWRQLVNIANETGGEDGVQRRTKSLLNNAKGLGTYAEGIFTAVQQRLGEGTPEAEQFNAALDRVRQAVLGVADAEGVLSQESQGFRNNSEELDDFLNNDLISKLPTAGESIIAAASAIATLGSAIQTVVGLVQTLSDDEIGPWEKLLNVMIATGTVIPMVGSTLAQLKIVFPSLTAATVAETGAQTAATVATEAHATAWTRLTAAMAANPIGAILIGILAAGTAIATVASIIDATTMSLEEAEEQIESFNEETKEFSSETSSFKEHVKDVEGLADEYERLSEKAGQYDKNIENLTESERASYNEIKEKLLEYNESLLLYYNGQGEAILNNNNAIEETIRLMQEEYELKRKELYNGEGAEKTQEAYDTRYKEAKKGAKNVKTNYNLDFSTGVGTSLSFLADYSIQDEEFTKLYSELVEAASLGSDAVLAFDEQNKERINSIFGNEDKSLNVEQVLAIYQSIVDYAKDFSELQSESQGEVLKAENELETASNIDSSFLLGRLMYGEDTNSQYAALQAAGIENADAMISAYVNGLKLGVNGIENYDDAIAAAQAFEEQILDLFLVNPNVQTSLQNAGDNFAEQTFSSYQDYVNYILTEINRLIQENPALAQFIQKNEEGAEGLFGSIFGTGNINFTTDTNGNITGVSAIDTTYTEATNKLQNALQGMDDEEIVSRATLTSLISTEDLANVDVIIDNLDEATVKSKGWVAALAEARDKLQEIKQIEDYTAKIETASDAIDTLLSGKELDDEQLEALQALEDEYGELATIQDKNSVAYLNKLLEIREALEAEQKILKENQVADIIDEVLEIDISKDGIESFQEKLKEVCEADYEVLVQVKSDVQDDFDTAVSSMEAVQEAAALIGDDFIVAGKDIEELNDAFPGILANMEILGDGTAKLNEEIVQSSMDAAKAEVQANTIATADKIANQAEELAVKKDAAQAIANIAYKMAQSSVHSEEELSTAKASIDSALNDLKSDNSEETSAQQQDDEINVAETSGDAAEDMAQNFGSAYQAMAEDAITWATTAHQALLYATNEDATAPEITGTFKGVGFQSVVDISANESNKAEISSDLSDYEDYNTVDWNSIGDYYQSLADAYGEAYNNAIGKIDELRVRGDDVSSDLSGAGRDGSGSSSDKDFQDLKKYDDEFDRYHDIKETIEELEDTISDLDKEQEHLAGNELADSLRKENKLIDQQVANYRTLLAMQKEEQGELQAELAQSGVAFDQSTGLMTNYAEATAAALQKLNAAITTYNNSAQEEADKLALEAAEETYERFKEALDRYDSLIEEIRDAENDIDDAFYQQVENTLEAWEAEIQVKLDLSEAKRTWEEFINEISKDFKSIYEDVGADMASLAKQAETYVGADGTIATAMSKVNYVEEFIDKANGMDYNSDAFRQLATSYGFASISEAQEKLQEYNEELQSAATELHDIYESAWDSYITGIDQAIEKFDNLIDQYERINDDLDHQSKMIELLYGDQAYDLLSQLYTAQGDNILGEMDSLRQQIDFYQQQYEQAAAAYGEDSEAADKFKEAWMDALDELNSQEEAYLEAIKNKAENAITEIFDTLERKLTNGSSLSWISEQWEDAQNAADGYYDNVERIYQLESLQNKFNDAIDSTSDLKTQQQLKSILDAQMSALEGKTKLSEYDIELAEKRLAVYQAQIALEEAQNNKTSMKLVRGQDGNWTYNYVADEDDVADKQQALIDANNDYYEFAKSSWEELTNKVVEDTQTALERISELEKESLTATAERQAEIAEQIAYLKEYYWGEEGLITLEIANQAEYERNLNQATAETLWGLYQIDEENYGLLTENEKALMDDLKDHGVNNFYTLYETISQNYDDIQTKCDEINSKSLNTWTTTAAEMCRMWNSSDDDSILTNVTSALESCNNAFIEYTNSIQKGCQAAGENFADVETQIRLDQQATADLESQTAQLVSNTCSYLEVYAQYLVQIAAMWDSVSASIRNATQQAIAYLATQGVDAQVTTTDTTTTNSSSAGATNAAAASGQGDGVLSVGDTATLTGSYYYDSAGTNPSGSKYSGVANGVVVDKVTSNGNAYSVHIHSADGKYGDLGWVKPSQLSGYDTGGYTGEWGGDGRLALLHQKELVLNSEDTENMLAAVQAVRDISGLGSSITSSIASSIAKMVAGLAGLTSIGNNFSNSSAITDNVNNTFEITMNVDGGDVEEIKQAVLSLPTLASQYLSRRSM